MAPLNDVVVHLYHVMEQYHAPEARGQSTMITGIVLMAIAVLLVINRFHVHCFTGRTPGFDDYLIVSSLVFCVAMNGVNTAAIQYGYGKHVSDVPKHDMNIALKLFYCFQVLYKCTINLTKVSIVLLYRRIFVTRFIFRLVCDYIVCLVATFAVASIFASIFQCMPVSRAWDRSIPGTCIDFAAFWNANGAWDILTDAMILTLPLPLLHTLGLPTQQRIGLVAIFTLGFL
ncbi:predicted protein [Uncinocarpus reesii 1704]|uniref:Rhodopsin domain-containing protein n=1 Tax=Uncinocarpus reesii (strain UAMH 1704) TaxID=336963 RepID=C4JUK1_UNCRE|nr:uncharacterized protein UREG_04804 [Uncinocarpus reesii 1704]EEP79962.1 predicted protein [Uncinocarpus reesii 1704]